MTFGPGQLGSRLARGLLVAGLLAFAVFSVRQTLGLAARIADPALARSLAPGNARIAGASSMAIIDVDGARGTQAAAVALARQALRRDATTVTAVTALGTVAAAQGKAAAAERLYGYAQTLSRRDLPTQVFLIENAVGHGDIARALWHYDVALRTSKAARNLLFPVLASALSEPAVRQATVAVIARRPAWSTDFLTNAANEGNSPQAVAAFFTGIVGRGIAVPRAAGDVLMARLVSLGDVATAWRYYRSVHPGVGRVGVHNGRFDPREAGASPFDWVLTNADGVTSSLDPAGDAGQLSVDLTASAAGIVAGQMQVLPPGRYQLSVLSSRMEGAPPPLSWQFSCAGGPRLTTIDVARSGTFAAGFEVGRDCPQQWLRLFGASGDGASGASGSFEAVTIEAQGAQ